MPGQLLNEARKEDEMLKCKAPKHRPFKSHVGVKSQLSGGDYSALLHLLLAV